METSRSTQRDRVFRFGPFELSECDAELRKGGVRIKLQDQPFRVLVELVANAGKVVSREELQQKLWSADTFVDFDVGLNNAIRKLRQALNDDADHPHYIETLAKRGYRFVAQVAELGGVPQPKTQSAQVGPDRLDHSQDRIAAESGGGTVSTKTLRERAMPWLLTVTVLAIAALGSYLWWRGKHSAPPLATEQRVTANPPEAPITAAAVSPDGKFVAYSDPTGVYIRHIDTGETRPLQLPAGFNAVPTSWFPDGTHLLLNSGGTQGNPSLWKASILGGTPQELIDNASRGAVSPDGSKIAFTRGDAEASGELWVIGSDGSNPHSIVDAALPEAAVSPGKGTTKQPYTGVLLSGVAWSPDGGRVAYLRRFEAVSIGPLTMKHSLETVDANGGIPKVLKISNQFLPVVGWAADGRLLYAYRDDPASEREDSAIWTLRVNQKSGEPEGKPLQLTKGVGRIGGLSVTADGRRLILWRVNSFPQVFLTEIDAETRRFKTPRRLTLDESTNIASSWTPDSRAVFFSSNRSGALQIYRQAIDQAVPEVLVEGRGIGLPRLNPDGTQVLYVNGYNPQGPSGGQSVMRVPLQGGSPRVVLHWPSIANIQCARSPSKFCLLATQEGLTVLFFTFDPEDGKTQEFTTFKLKGGGLNWSLSPDGSQLALIFQGSERRVTFMAVSDKSTHEVELKQWPLRRIDWAADGKSVLVSSRTANGAPVVLGVEPNSNYKVLLVGDGATQFLAVIPSPDGRYAALDAVTGENNVWMVENF